MTTEETLAMHAARITRGASIMRQPHKPWERLKALEEVEASLLSAKRILMMMEIEQKPTGYGPEVERQEKAMSYGPANERNGRREME